LPPGRAAEGDDRFESLDVIFTSERLAEVVRLAKKSPEEAAAIAELAVVKSGTFARAEAATSDRARVAIWNMQRGRNLEEWLRIDAIRQADVLLLSELDEGMARSGNVNVTHELASRLGMHYAFAPNYFEFTNGNWRERKATRALANAVGLHGTAILSRWPLFDVTRVPLPLKFDWFRHYEQRVGTRVALVAKVDPGTGPITFASAHLEVFATPEERSDQMRALLRALPDSPSPAVLGGDFNTFGVRPSYRRGLELFARRVRHRGRHVMAAVHREPLFEEARRVGFSWENANANAATWWFGGFSPSLTAKLDWAFVRALDVEPESVAVVRAVGSRPAARLSDHDGLELTVRSPGTRSR
jgi:endonuclease/exonuclease/phosphatase family metal-dependent hydrolase